ncbi:hypothetical protein N7492_000577 [Penicillium capsulatum]|uniref:DHHA2 domain-containing protein n=1 Tax=Penicillium capsulatum TaxID=69766 RepID=A0A9W9IT27_9EURO|nr:hypothetical protein N7492_000577 [Penicillium capsulatum]KAJ6130365.1 hypothetical protein N7512_003145 [Penicillium capsulatum]
MTLLQFLRQARQVHLQFLSGALPESPIYVLGNPSADLDSIISAIVYSYCANNRLPSTTPRLHVPVLNLPTVPAGPELYRLRPEFVTALHRATNFPALKHEAFANSSESAGKLLREHIVTVADFAQSLKERPISNQLLADATLVDWNAMPDRAKDQHGRGLLAGLGNVSFRVVGCIDHHVDEHFVPQPDSLPDNQPKIIQPGPGSCASLIVSEMEKRGLWTADATASEIAQVAKLALAPVLIDTSNLQAEGKVTDVDIRAVQFLLRQVASAGEASSAWDAEAFYEEILTAKKNSLDLLTLDEVLDRDYKDWTETSQVSGQKIKLGFCSSVKPIRWIVEKAGGPQKFVDAVRSFARQEDKGLDVIVVMTSFTSGDDQFARELFITASAEKDVAVDGVRAFIAQSTSELDLVEWSALDGESVDVAQDQIQSALAADSGPWQRLWVQKNTKASRKQVAPLLRSAVATL